MKKMLRGLCCYCRTLDQRLDERIKWFGIRLRQFLVRESWSEHIREKRRMAEPERVNQDYLGGDPDR